VPPPSDALSGMDTQLRAGDCWSRSRIARRASAVCVSMLLLGSSGLAGALGDAATPVVLSIVDGQLEPGKRLIRVNKGDLVRWHVISSTRGELHLHAYRLAVPLEPAQQREVVFTAFATGRFRLEWHAPQEVRPPAGRHAQALAILEVRPP
jgi:hypothetical protein